MPRRVLRVLAYRVPITELSTKTTYAAAVYGVWQGVGLMVSSPARFGSPSFVIIRHGPFWWGLSALIFGLLVAWGMWEKHFGLKAFGLLGLSAWSAVFASTALSVLASSPIAAPTGPPAYYLIATVLAILVWADPKVTSSAAPPPPQ